jgi:hypothetical protein
MLSLFPTSVVADKLTHITVTTSYLPSSASTATTSCQLAQDGKFDSASDEINFAVCTVNSVGNEQIQCTAPALTTESYEVGEIDEF